MWIYIEYSKAGHLIFIYSLLQMTFKQIGKGGIETSYIISKCKLKKLVKKGGADNVDVCQQNINKDIEKRKPEWLQLTHVLQNIHGKGVASMIAKIDTKDVVVKVQLANNAVDEYQFQERLKVLNGFIQYQCYFTCNGDNSYIEQFANHRDLKKNMLCTENGTSMGVIVMPYYPNGSLEDCLKQYTDAHADIKSILVNIIQNAFNAYTKIGFTHGDLFTKNVLLDAEYKPVLIDFEKSKVDQDQVTFWRDIDDLLGDVSRFIYRNQINDISRIIMINRAYNIHPNDQNIQDLLQAIQNIQ
jgi:serine/threonine protein kinase